MSDMRQMTEQGRRIETDSFAIIDSEVGPHEFPPSEWQIVRRVIHSTADFEFKDLMAFHPDAVNSGIRALRRGCPLVLDVQMIAAGLNQERLQHFGCQTYCSISDPDVIARAKELNTTRAIESMRKLHMMGKLEGSIIAIGNAPTALLEVLRLIADEDVRPALIIGVPVGFVSAAESKDLLAQSQVPWLAARGRKGGSTIAVAILHALFALAVEA
ncbi:MAG TPA: precorrin-8X methylmutase [Oligoflexus sp.]|uniref:precorrin-8X methylmutase n=1 Tax=Oligoflexus sp. TaxID=1971216 RepID=UPI002D7FB5E4|nr:precorrin-8X methylmutase [Oligoflexus sp.]HET9238265.1 precorrin-8X methylmutase [Oligoflexus sp.]